MVKMSPLDPAFPLDHQIAIDASPIVLVNLLTVDPADEAAFLKAWADDSEFMKHQPGFISTQLHRALGAHPTYLNYAVFESTAAWRAGFQNPEFRKRLQAHPDSVVARPHLFQKVAVKGICVA